MPLRTSVRTEKIVEAAAQLFARQGYHGTSTREIARLAEVSENTLFRHFHHKEDIFWSALRSRTVALAPRLDLLDGIRTTDAPEVVLPQIFDMLADTVNYRSEVLRLIAIAFLELQENAERYCRDLLSPLISQVGEYLKASFEKGKVKEIDPILLIASFLAMTLMHPHILKMMNTDSSSHVDSRDAARAYSKFWLDVLNPTLPDRSISA